MSGVKIPRVKMSDKMTGARELMRRHANNEQKRTEAARELMLWAAYRGSNLYQCWREGNTTFVRISSLKG